MPVTCGIVGLPNSGKTTLFNAFTASRADRAIYPFSTTEAAEAMVNVPDGRLERIHKHIETERIVHAAVAVVDIPGLVPGSSTGKGLGNKFLGSIKECDAILHVVRCFDAPDVVRDGPVDPAGDMEVLELELVLGDLDTVSRNLERVGKKARAAEKQALFEQQVFARAKEALEQGKTLRTLDWKPAELEALRPLFLITLKPTLYVANIDQADLEGTSERAALVAAHAERMRAQSTALCGDIECELVNMQPEERAEFQREFKIAELGLPRLIRATYALLGLQTFFTAGPKEIRAWTIHRGDTAPLAAGVIHTDFEKHFIRAEIYSVEDLEAHKSEPAIRAAGKLRVEGRDYVMRPRDVAHFLIAK